jgi:hypothetical protein
MFCICLFFLGGGDFGRKFEDERLYKQFSAALVFCKTEPRSHQMLLVLCQRTEVLGCADEAVDPAGHLGVCSLDRKVHVGTMNLWNKNRI